jgi:hypothetical protein
LPIYFAPSSTATTANSSSAEPTATKWPAQAAHPCLPRVDPPLDRPHVESPTPAEEFAIANQTVTAMSEAFGGHFAEDRLDIGLKQVTRAMASTCRSATPPGALPAHAFG